MILQSHEKLVLQATLIKLFCRREIFRWFSTSKQIKEHKIMKNTINFLVVAAIFVALTLGCGGSNATAPAANTATTPGANTAAANTATASNTAVASNTSTSSPLSDAAASSGELVRLEDAGISFVYPKNYKISKEPGLVTISTPDGGIGISFTTLEQGSFSQSVEAAGKELGKQMKNVKITQNGKKGVTGGMDSVSGAGYGTDITSGKSVAFELSAIDAPKKPVLVVIYGESQSILKYESEYKGVFDSIKKL